MISSYKRPFLKKLANNYLPQYVSSECTPNVHGSARRSKYMFNRHKQFHFLFKTNIFWKKVIGLLFSKRTFVRRNHRKYIIFAHKCRLQMSINYVTQQGRRGSETYVTQRDGGRGRG